MPLVHPDDVPTVPVSVAASAPVLLDVREDDEWAAGHAPQAVHVPMHDVPQAIADLPADRPLHVICKVGGRSAQVVAFLRGQGVEAVNVDGGMLAWLDAGLPVVR